MFERGKRIFPAMGERKCPGVQKLRSLLTDPILFAAAKTLGFDIDYKRLLKECTGLDPRPRSQVGPILL
jgi:hypothetical protein